LIKRKGGFVGTGDFVWGRSADQVHCAWTVKWDNRTIGQQDNRTIGAMVYFGVTVMMVPCRDRITVLAIMMIIISMMTVRRRMRC
jgi:hypothetical protein